MRIGIRQLSWQVAIVFILAAYVHGDEVADREPVALSRHETVAEFQGTKHHKCVGLTSLCPEKCGHSGTLATFKIVNYLTYEKLGKYGDPKCDEFAFLVEDNMKHAMVPAEIRAAVNALKQGDIVLLSWSHNYVTVSGNPGPQQPISRLEKVADVGTQAWFYQIDRRAGIRDTAGYEPTIGSDEWKSAISANLGVYDDLGHGPTPDSGEWQSAIHRKTFGVKPAKKIAVAYRSAANEELRVTYDNFRQTVTLHMSKKDITLPRAVSASGARYATGDEEFWNKGSHAIYRKGGTLLFEGSE